MSTFWTTEHRYRQNAAQAVQELRHGIALGTPTTAEIMPRPKEGRHARLSMRVCPHGDQWVLMIKDQTGPGRHRECTVCNHAVQAAHPGHKPRDAGCIT